MLRTDLIQRCTANGFLITQEAVLALQEQPDPNKLLDELLQHIDKSTVVIGISHVNGAEFNALAQEAIEAIIVSESPQALLGELSRLTSKLTRLCFQNRKKEGITTQ
jgi:hypothetical protein